MCSWPHFCFILRPVRHGQGFVIFKLRAYHFILQIWRTVYLWGGEFRNVTVIVCWEQKEVFFCSFTPPASIQIYWLFENFMIDSYLIIYCELETRQFCIDFVLNLYPWNEFVKLYYQLLFQCLILYMIFNCPMQYLILWFVINSCFTFTSCQDSFPNKPNIFNLATLDWHFSWYPSPNTNYCCRCQKL